MIDWTRTVGFERNAGHSALPEHGPAICDFQIIGRITGMAIRSFHTAR